MAAVVVRLRQQVEPAEVALVLPPLVVVEAAVAARPLLEEEAVAAERQTPQAASPRAFPSWA